MGSALSRHESFDDNRMIALSFHGAAQTVTGSKYLVRVDDDSLLIDCGLFQGLKELRLRNWDSPPFDAHKVRWIVLTHCHIDHIGYLPRLFRRGFRGDILCSAPTARMMEILLLDAAHLQEEDAYYLNKEGKTRHKPALPLFTQEDARAVCRLVKPVPLTESVQLSPHLSFSLRLVGHILGACSILVTIREGSQTKTVYFGGDIGRYSAPLVPDPQSPLGSDYLVLESTYGDRRHEAADPYETIGGLVQQIVERKGVLLIPAFAVGRTQQIVLILRDLEDQGRIPRLPIHVDSPMAVDATDIYCEFETWHRLDVARLGGTDCGLHAKNITYHRTREESMAINKLDGPRIIISSGGMLTGGRVLHHLVQRMAQQENIIALVGFQAVGTRGRDLLDGKKLLRFHGELHTVRAQVVDVGGLSGHADYTELMRWLTALDKPPQTTFITHGEPAPAAAMAARVRDERGFRAVIPILGDEFQL